MAINQKTWVNNEVITANDLNNLQGNSINQVDNIHPQYGFNKIDRRGEMLVQLQAGGIGWGIASNLSFNFLKETSMDGYVSGSTSTGPADRSFLVGRLALPAGHPYSQLKINYELKANSLGTTPVACGWDFLVNGSYSGGGGLYGIVNYATNQVMANFVSKELILGLPSKDYLCLAVRMNVSSFQETQIKNLTAVLI